ncbi:MAG: AbrB/MazE/SpoVT family DNA-binding domain-containing protein [Anaerolineales bacterium]
MGAYFKTHEVTLPAEIRSLLGLNEGDDVAFSLNEQGQGIVSRLEVVPPDQAWFWTEQWQKAEREAQADIDAGRTHRYASVDDALAALEKRADAGN